MVFLSTTRSTHRFLCLVVFATVSFTEVSAKSFFSNNGSDEDVDPLDKLLQLERRHSIAPTPDRQSQSRYMIAYPFVDEPPVTSWSLALSAAAAAAAMSESMLATPRR